MLIGVNIINEIMVEIYRVLEVIEIIDFFLFFVMIEFFLMVIDLLFIKIDDFNGGLFFVYFFICIYNKNILNNYKCICFLI